MKPTDAERLELARDTIDFLRAKREEDALKLKQAEAKLAEVRLLAGHGASSWASNDYATGFEHAMQEVVDVLDNGDR